mmetsp:Transcript_7664/g.22482  ORF Transcript_7664/g.22482 Transcript_7664/m.22482 type:complete len:253 (+) Transcript_7664:839-1597(+)
MVAIRLIKMRRRRVKGEKRRNKSSPREGSSSFLLLRRPMFLPPSPRMGRIRLKANLHNHNILSIRISTKKITVNIREAIHLLTPPTEEALPLRITTISNRDRQASVATFFRSSSPSLLLISQGRPHPTTATEKGGHPTGANRMAGTVPFHRTRRTCPNVVPTGGASSHTAAATADLKIAAGRRGKTWAAGAVHPHPRPCSEVIPTPIRAMAATATATAVSIIKGGGSMTTVARARRKRSTAAMGNPTGPCPT